jgi:hypothetical protein
MDCLRRVRTTLDPFSGACPSPGLVLPKASLSAVLCPHLDTLTKRMGSPVRIVSADGRQRSQPGMCWMPMRIHKQQHSSCCAVTALLRLCRGAAASGGAGAASPPARAPPVPAALPAATVLRRRLLAVQAAWGLLIPAAAASRTARPMRRLGQTLLFTLLLLLDGLPLFPVCCALSTRRCRCCSWHSSLQHRGRLFCRHTLVCAAPHKGQHRGEALRHLHAGLLHGRPQLGQGGRRCRCRWRCDLSSG